MRCKNEKKGTQNTLKSILDSLDLQKSKLKVSIKGLIQGRSKGGGCLFLGVIIIIYCVLQVTVEQKC